MAARHLVADLNFTLLRNIYAHQFGNAGRKLVLVLSGEHLYVYDYTALAVGYFKGSIAHLSRLLSEDCAQKSFLGGKLGFALGRNFTDKNITGLNLRAYSYNTVRIQIFKRVLGNVGNIPRNLLRAELGISRLGFVLLDMDRREYVVLY